MSNFFQELDTLEIDTVTIIVKRSPDGNITVFVPIKDKDVKDSAVKGLKPFSLTTTPKLMDEHFFSKISTPLVNTTKWIDNLKQAEHQLEEQKKKTDIEKAKKAEIKKLSDAIKKILDKDDFDADKDKRKATKAIKELADKFPNEPFVNVAKSKLLELTRGNGEITMQLD